MNGFEPSNYLHALKALNELLDLIIAYDLNYARNNEQSQGILTILKSRVHSYYQQSSQPLQLHAYHLCPFDLYYICLYNLYHNPLVPIEFGSQSKLNQCFIQQIIQARAYFQICEMTFETPHIPLH
ncbi:hypothetical protein B4W74_07550 [Staphylococcus intermedius]|uniref:Uncharacterized protein n=1 Tax=Staphylococcus intermedius NCTC 11048 TaxID=1141106 RepID=A0A380G5C4_STAIN|nr:hypothetical protein [Staphylococcus intermedius]PCF63758.1 hypothetical protein B5C04_07200 [Staphylococcus intermedius]PCF78473.1 hypothetical protein B4W74_07550 [Staphylococcus intermedius]PCF79447.1 hypothetical protein B4W70_07190 [Staphylococcus intermedius]PCF86817.1 hypothetical protein B4W76_07115 [Staphylococcus intermedius]PCF89897.1 hypothetical protein B4W75_03360 [Staphylococcus intermedius]